MFITEPGYAEQLTRWGLDELAGAMGFPAQVGPPPLVPHWRRVAGGSNTACYRLAPPTGPAAATPPAREVSGDEADRPLFLKQYRYLRPSWGYLFRRSRAAREAASLRTLARLGIHCPRVVALGEVRQPGPFWLTIPTAPLALLLRWTNRDLLAGAALITTAIEPSQDLDRFSRTHWRCDGRVDATQSRQVDRLSRQLAAQVAVIHRARFVHRDLKFRNLLVCWPQGQSPQVDNLRLAWIDCPQGGRVPPGPWLTHWRIGDLAGLDRNAMPYATRTQRLRFLRDYLLHYGGDASLAEMRRIVRRIATRHARRLRLQRRRGEKQFAPSAQESA